MRLQLLQLCGVFAATVMAAGVATAGTEEAGVMVEAGAATEATVVTVVAGVEAMGVSGTSCLCAHQPYPHLRLHTFSVCNDESLSAGLTAGGA